jgi:biopolymer transport protein ExbD
VSTDTNLRPRRRDSPELNVTSLIDVVLLLLIFFMLSTTFNRYAEMQVELPHASATASDQQAPRIDLTVDRVGNYYVNGRQVVTNDTDVLRQALLQARKGRSEVTVEISADGRTPHQAVITAMDAAGQAGLNHIAFATTREGDASQ